MRMCDIYNTPESIVFQEKKKKKKNWMLALSCSVSSTGVNCNLKAD